MAPPPPITRVIAVVVRLTPTDSAGSDLAGAHVRAVSHRGLTDGLRDALAVG